MNDDKLYINPLITGDAGAADQPEAALWRGGKQETWGLPVA